MPTYLVQLAGINSLSNIEAQIRGEEAGASKFVESHVTYYQQTVTNIATFEELPPGTLPTQIYLDVPTGPQAPLPAGRTLVWAGVMVVAGMTQPVRASR